MIEDAKTLFQNSDYKKTFIAFLLLWGNYTAFGNVLNPFFESIFNPSEIAVIGMGFVFCGLLGCLAMGVYLDKT